MTAENRATEQTENKASRGNGKHPPSDDKQQRVISSPNDVANVVLLQVDQVNAKKDELTIAIKGLTDTTKQLVRVYAEHSAAIKTLQEKVKELEENKGK